MLLKEIKFLIAKDISLELKQKYALNGILLYILSTIFICYLTFTRIIDPETWNSLFWVIMLFAAVNAISKSFVQEPAGRQYYYYTLASPQGVILSKIIYNILLMGLISLLAFLVFSVLMGQFVTNYGIFVAGLLLGSFGFSGILTMVAAIASRTSNNFTLMAILSFPLALPLLILLMKLSKNALSLTSWGACWQYLLGLGFINLIVVLLAFILFPYVWKD